MMGGLDQLTPRESVLMEREDQQATQAYEHQVTMKRLDTEAKVELKKLELMLRQQELKWQQLLRVPLIILRLPLVPFLGLAYIVLAISGKPVQEDFWKFLK